MGLTCPNCGNEKNFLVKTLQMHILQVEEAGVDISEERHPAVLEVLCDECDTEVDLQGVDTDLRREILQTLGAR
jgi:hypothetical protein